MPVRIDAKDVMVRLAPAWVLGVLLAWSAWVKLVDLEGFALILYRYDLLPTGLVNLAAVMVTGLETVLALALLCGCGLRRGAALLGAGLFALFALLSAVTLWRGLDIACGCFSTDPESSRVGWWTVARGLLLAGIGLWVFFAERARGVAIAPGGEPGDTARAAPEPGPGEA